MEDDETKYKSRENESFTRLNSPQIEKKNTHLGWN